MITIGIIIELLAVLAVAWTIKNHLEFMRKCTLTFDMWLHSCDDECPTFEQIGEDFENCGTCKWFKEV